MRIHLNSLVFMDHPYTLGGTVMLPSASLSTLYSTLARCTNSVLKIKGVLIFSVTSINMVYAFNWLLVFKKMCKLEINLYVDHKITYKYKYTRKYLKLKIYNHYSIIQLIT